MPPADGRPSPPAEPAPARLSCVRTCEAITGRAARRRQAAGQTNGRPSPPADGRPSAHTRTHTHTRSRQRHSAGHRHGQTNSRPPTCTHAPDTQAAQQAAGNSHQPKPNARPREETTAPALIPPPYAPPPTGGGSSWRQAAPLRVRERKIFLGMMQKSHFRWPGRKNRGGVKKRKGEKASARRRSRNTATGGELRRQGLAWERVIFVFLYGTARVREDVPDTNVGHKMGR